MAELLLELLSEEIPARMQARAAAELERLVCERLKAAGLEFSHAAAFATPRRLALVVDGLPARQPDVCEERRGPRAEAPEKAIAGFLASVGLEREQLEARETPKGTFLFALIERPGRATDEVLADIIWDVILGFPWPRSMTWGKGDLKWVRPLHSILAVFAGNVIQLAVEREGSSVQFDLRYQSFNDSYTPEHIEKFGTLIAGNATYGHRFHAPDAITVTGFEDYRDKLLKARVVLDPAERARLILDGAGKLAKGEGLMLIEDEELLAEVTGLVEWPVPLMGAVDASFMDLPAEVLATTMKSHQKYFSLRDKAGALAPRFIVVVNQEADDKGAAIVAGNERVLKARLADARFFWDQDRKQSLESRVAALDAVIFHDQLGSLKEKAERITGLAGRLCEYGYVPGADEDKAKRAARLCKADLLTGMVGEFPELQGVMGRYYALADGEDPAVAEAIGDHYAPQGPSDRCPTAPVSVAVALADKIDTLFWFFAIDEKPTGSRDPFALRRAALGVIRLIVENGLRVPLLEAFKEAAFGGLMLKTGDEDRIAAELLDFFADRLKVHLREKGVRHDLIDAVFALGGEDDLVRLLKRVDALARFLDSADGANLLVAYRRAANIVRIEEKKDATSYDGAADDSLLEQDEERALAALLPKVAEASKAALGKDDFEGAMAALARLRAPVDAFFDHVTVNTDEAALRRNRLRLLSRIRATLGAVADFSRIEG